MIGKIAYNDDATIQWANTDLSVTRTKIDINVFNVYTLCIFYPLPIVYVRPVAATSCH